MPDLSVPRGTATREKSKPNLDELPLYQKQFPSSLGIPLEKLHFYPKGRQKNSFPKSIRLRSL